MKMKFGVMGPGRIAHSFSGAIREIEDAEIVAVASRSSVARAKAFAEEEHIGKYYGSYEELLADDEINAIYIATTHNFHKDNIIMCLNAGKHVLCEKPMVLTVEDTKEVVALAKEKHLFLMEAMWARFLPKSLKVCEWVKSGRIGDVKLAQGTIGFVAPVDYSDRFYNPELAGGTLYDMGIYLIDLLPYWANQEIVNVEAAAHMAETGVDVQLNITMELEHAIASGQATVQATVPEDAFIYGSKGYIKVPKMHWGSEAILYDANQQEVEHFAEPCAYGFKYEVLEMMKCVEEGRIESDIASHAMSIMNCQIFEKFMNEWKK